MKKWHPETAGVQKIEGAAEEVKTKTGEAIDAAKKKLS